MSSLVQTKAFKGLNNVTDPLRLAKGWLTKADNVDISDTGRLSRREGYSQTISGSFTGAYNTVDYNRLFVVDNGNLKRIHDDLTSEILRSNLDPAPMYWTEVNREVFYSNGVSKGIISADNVPNDWSWPSPGTPSLSAGTGPLRAGLYQVACTYLLADGRETGGGDTAQIQLPEGSSLRIGDIPQVAGLRTQVYIAPADSAQFQLAFESAQTTAVWSAGPDSLGANLTTLLLDPPPLGAQHVAFYAGRMYLMEFMPASNTTVIWFSQPLGYHLFDLNQDFMLVRGQGVLLHAHAQGLVIGTTTEIHGYDGEALTLLADYGAIPGWNATVDENDEARPLYFWTHRGICSVFPFVNLTGGRVSVPPGVCAGAAVISREGARRYVVSLQKGDSAFNPRSYP
jgi:hypothetical protein